MANLYKSITVKNSHDAHLKVAASPIYCKKMPIKQNLSALQLYLDT